MSVLVALNQSLIQIDKGGLFPDSVSFKPQDGLSLGLPQADRELFSLLQALISMHQGLLYSSQGLGVCFVAMRVALEQVVDIGLHYDNWL